MLVYLQFHPKLLRVYFVMGSQDCHGRNPVEILESAIAGGITLFQYREKDSDLSLAETLELGKQLRHVCRLNKIPFIVNDRADLALLLDADGVHVGQEDLPADAVRRIIGPNRFLGVSVETPAEAVEAQQKGANYLGVGPMYTTASKSDAGNPIGPGAITAIREQMPSPLPIVGIGGITASRTPAVLQAGADGVAVISAIAAQKKPQHATMAIRQAVEKVLG